MDRGPSSRTLSAGTPVSGNRTESPSLTTPARRSSTDSTVNALSPMHPPKAVHRDEENEVVVTDEASWVGRKVDALFSPVLSFLNNAAEDSLRDAPTASTVSTAEGTSPTNENVNISSSLDDEESLCDSMVAMEDVEDEDEFNPWQFIKCLPDYAYVRHLCPPITLPPKTSGAPPITLVLDLDETLVHCTVEPVENADLTFPVDFHNVTYQVHVRLRPHLFTFLSRIEGQYEIVLFTASQKVYANELLNRIDPDGKYFHHRLYRESCLAVEGNYLKDLNVLGRDLSRTVLVDNSPHAFGYQVDNGIPIESWFDDPDDRELLKLERFLRQLEPGSVREAVRNKFQCHTLIAKASGNQ